VRPAPEHVTGTAGFPHEPLPKYVHLGPGAKLDMGVILGYPPARTVPVLDLHIGERARIRSGTVIYAGSRIGSGLETGHNVVLREECSIGDDFRAWNGTVVDYACTIGRGVKVHSNCYVSQGTVLEDGSFLAPGVVLANDLHPGSERSKALMRGPVIGRGAQLGCNVTVLPYVRVGAGCVVGAGAVVVKDLPEGSVAVGNPARVIKRVADLADADVEQRAKGGA
jgi:acetyltransferase-like isoleucine patch superfamily enzyme